MGDHRKLTQDELYAEARQRFGPDPRDWAFRCPGCGDIATARDFPEGTGDRIGQECIGRHRGALEGAPGDDRGDASRGCDWAAYGLIRGPWIITMPDGSEIGSFPLADSPAPEPSRKGAAALGAPLADLWPGGPDGTIATRTRNRLLRAGFKTIGQVAASTAQDLLDLRDFGHGQLREVQRVLAAAGLALQEEGPQP